jgi:hypothetical protein
MIKIKQSIDVFQGDLLTIEMEDHGDYIMLALGESTDEGDKTYMEEVVSKDDLKKLRDAIDFMIGEEK